MAENTQTLDLIEIGNSTTVLSGKGVGGKGVGGKGGARVTSFSVAYASRQHNAFPTAHPKLISRLSMDFSLPEPLQRSGGLLARTVQARISNKHDGTIAEQSPSPSYLQHTAGLTGKIARARKVLTRGGSPNAEVVGDAMTLTGSVAINTLTRKVADISILAEDQQAMVTLVPKVLTLDRFPSADITTVSGRAHPILLPFGVWKGAEIALCMGANYADFSFTIAGAESDKYHYADITNIADTPIVTGYWLEYDLHTPSATTRVAMDLKCSDGTTLRGQVTLTDQNGFSVHPSTDLSSKCVNAIYRRRISLDALAGKTVNKFLGGCENNTAGTYSAKIGQAVILDSHGTVIREIITRNIPSLTLAADDISNGGNSATASKDNGYYFGAFRSSGSLVIEAVKREEQVIPEQEYGTVNFLGCLLIRFDTRQVDQQGRPVAMTADVFTSEFSERAPAVGRFLLSDATYGVGLAVSSASFAAAIAAHEIEGVKVAGGLDRQRPFGDVQKDLQFLGDYVWKNTDAEVEWITDTLGLHTQSGIDLEEGLQGRGWNNFEITNAAEALPTQRLKRLVCRGGFLKESWLTNTDRSRDTEGVDGEPLDYPYVYDPDSLDRICHRQWWYALARDNPLAGRITRFQDGLGISIGQTVTVYSEILFNPLEYMITRLADNASGSFDINAVRYYPETYEYERGTNISPASPLLSGTDYSHTPPSPPVNFTIVGEPVIRVTEDGLLESIVTVTADGPELNPDNVSDIVFQLVRLDEPSQEVTVPCTPGQTGCRAEFVLQMALAYVINAYSLNKANVPTAQRGGFATPLAIAGPLDDTPPTAPTWIEATVSLDAVNLTWNENAEKNIRKYEIWRSLTNNSADAVLQSSVGKGTTQYQDQKFSGITAETIVYYFLRVENTSGYFSPFSTSLSATIPSLYVTYVENPASTDLTGGDDYDINSISFTPKAGTAFTIQGEVDVEWLSGVDTADFLTISLHQTSSTNTALDTATINLAIAGDRQSGLVAYSVFPTTAASRTYVLNADLNNFGGGVTLRFHVRKLTIQHLR